MSKRRVLVGVIASLVVVSVAWSTKAQAEGGSSVRVDATAMGQSLRAQLEGHVHAYEFALVQHGRLELTGHSDNVTASGAVAMAQSTAFGGDERFCHLSLGDIEAALIVEEPAGNLPQPCALIGAAAD